MPEAVLVIACGALAREIDALKKRFGWSHLHMQCIDARLHNRPALIAGRLREKILANRGRYSAMYVAYADCGTAGAIDAVLDEFGIERLPGAHCYEFFAGRARFAALSEAEPGTFYLTDFLAKNFERLVLRPLAIDTHPELRDAYFGNYRRLVYLSQADDVELEQAARSAAERLGLEYRHVPSGYGGLGAGLQSFIEKQVHGQEDARLLA